MKQLALNSNEACLVPSRKYVAYMAPLQPVLTVLSYLVVRSCNLCSLRLKYLVDECSDGTQPRDAKSDGMIKSCNLRALSRADNVSEQPQHEVFPHISRMLLSYLTYCHIDSSLLLFGFVRPPKYLLG